MSAIRFDYMLEGQRPSLQTTLPSDDQPAGVLYAMASTQEASVVSAISITPLSTESEFVKLLPYGPYDVNYNYDLATTSEYVSSTSYHKYHPTEGSNLRIEELRPGESHTQAGVDYTSMRHYIVHDDVVHFDKDGGYTIEHHDTECNEYHIRQSTVPVEDHGNRLIDYNQSWMAKLFTYISPIFLLFGWVNFFEAVIKLVKADNKNYERWMDCAVAGITAVGTTLAFALTIAAVAGFIYAAPYVIGAILGLGILRRLYYFGKSLHSAWKARKSAHSEITSEAVHKTYQNERNFHLKTAAQHFLGIITNALSLAALCYIFQAFQLKTHSTVDYSYLSSIDPSLAVNTSQYGNTVAQFLQTNIVDSANAFSNTAFNLIISIFVLAIPGLIMGACRLNKESLGLLRGEKSISDTFEAKAIQRIKSVFDLRDSKTPLFFKITKILFSPLIVTSYGVIGVGHFLFRSIAALIFGGLQALCGFVSSKMTKKPTQAQPLSVNDAELKNQEHDLTVLTDEIERDLANKIQRVKAKITPDLSDESVHKHQGQQLLLETVQNILSESKKASQEQGEVKKEPRDYNQDIRAIEELETIILHGKDPATAKNKQVQALVSNPLTKTAYPNVYQNFFKSTNTTQDLVIKTKQLLGARQRLFGANNKMSTSTALAPDSNTLRAQKVAAAPEF